MTRAGSGGRSPGLASPPPAAHWLLSCSRTPPVPDQLRDGLAAVGVTDVGIDHTAWYWLAALGAVGSLVATVLAVAWAPAWPEMGSRYDAPTALVATSEAPPEEQSSLDLWKALDEGRDPTAADPE